MKDIKSMTLAELGAELKVLGEPAFRAKQIYRWMHRGVRDFSEMTDISRSLRERLTAEYTLVSPTVARRLQSQKDGTIKYLWRLMDGNCVESVLMRYHYGNTICISSEVGCRMGCAFCASTRGGLVRRLEPSEMLDQVLFSQLDSGLPISHIVLMGIGEPLDNYDNVRRFLELVNSPEGLNIGMRHISLSTCGLVDQIDRLAEEDLQLTLSVSLHAPVDEVRSSIMPVNRRWPVQELLDACRRYFEKTGRRISFEYAMIRDVNDTPEMAKQLIRRLRGIAAHVNLIPLNDVVESPLKPSLPETVLRFQKTLEASGIPALKRTTRDEPDYHKLMEYRLGILREHGLGLREIQATIAQIDPLPGARAFLDELRSFTQVLILSDTFEQFAQPLMKKLNWPTLFCNTLEVAPDGAITGFRMRCPQSKLTTVKALQSIGYDTIAAGDSYNDLGMIQASRAGFLFKSTAQIKADHPEVPAYEGFDELLAAIRRAMD